MENVVRTGIPGILFASIVFFMLAGCSNQTMKRRQSRRVSLLAPLHPLAVVI